MMKLIATSNTIEVIDVNRIISIEAYQNYSKFYLTNNELLVSRDSLATLEKTIGEGFFRIHHSHIINLHFMRRYFRTGSVEMRNGKVFDVARRRRTEFVEFLDKQLGSSSSH